MWPYVPWLEYGIWGYGHPIIIREEENENRNCKESNPVFNSWRQVPPHLWELNLCVCVCAWRTKHAEPNGIKSVFSCFICCANYWSSNYSHGPHDAICFIENCHWINANELVDFEVNVGTPSGCKIGCRNSMSSRAFADARFKSGFYSVRFGSICQSFLSRRIKFWFNSSPDPGAFQGFFKGPLKSAYCVEMFLHSESDAVCLS